MTASSSEAARSRAPDLVDAIAATERLSAAIRAVALIAQAQTAERARLAAARADREETFEAWTAASRLLEVALDDLRAAAKALGDLAFAATAGPDL